MRPPSRFAPATACHPLDLQWRVAYATRHCKRQGVVGWEHWPSNDRSMPGAWVLAAETVIGSVGR